MWAPSLRAVPAGPPPGTQTDWPELERWVQTARSEGLDDDSIEALAAHHPAPAPRWRGSHERDSDIGPPSTSALGKRYGSLWALTGLRVSVPRRQRHRTGRTQRCRRRQRCCEILAGLSAPSDRQRHRARREPCRQSEEFLDEYRLPGPGCPALQPAQRRRPPGHGRPSQSALGCQRRTGATGRPEDSRLTGRSATLSGGQRAQVGLGWRWPNDPGCSSSTNRWPLSTRWPAASFWPRSPRRWPTGTCRSSCPLTSCMTSSASAITSILLARVTHSALR